MNQDLAEGKKIGDFVVRIKEVLGRGKFGVVYKGFNEKSNYPVAVKISPNNWKLDKEGLAKIQEDPELKLLRQLKHPNLIYLYDIRITTNHIYLMLELCNGGTLTKYLEQKEYKLTDLEALKILKQICEGYKYLYEHQIIHRDLKPDNIMLNDGVVKISDFGFARRIEGDPNTVGHFTLKGTPLYLPPQVFDTQQYSSKFDVWSLGVIFYEMLYNGQRYLKNVKTMEQLRKALLDLKGKEPNFPPSDRSRKLIEILTGMLQFEEQNRISWVKQNVQVKDQIFEHDFFRLSAEAFLGVSEDGRYDKTTSFNVVSLDEKLKLNVFFKQMIICCGQLENHISPYQILGVKCFILKNQRIFIKALLDYEKDLKMFPNMKEYLIGFLRELENQLQFHSVLFRERVNSIDQHQEAKKRTDTFIAKSLNDQLKLEDIVSVLPREKFEGLKLALTIVDSLKDKDKDFDLIDLEKLTSLENKSDLESVCKQLKLRIY